MPFADLKDVNDWLPEDKYRATDESIVDPGIDADRLIRARLGNVVDVALFPTWDTPANTPEIIREISGLLIASTLYADATAEDFAEVSPYAQNLYQRAMDMLERLRTGDDVIIGVDGTQIATDISSDLAFYPDDTTEPTFAVADFWS